MWLRPWTNGPIPGCKCGHTFTGQHNRTICHRVQVYTCSRSPEPTSTFSSLVPPARPFTGFKTFSLYICLNLFAILFYPNIYINITICLSIFSFESQQGTIFQFDGIFWCDCCSQTKYTFTYTSSKMC